MAITIQEIRAFSDNYIWLLDNNGFAVVIDPGEDKAVKKVLQSQQLELVAILITHHHFDHTGGIEALLNSYPACKVFGPAKENIPHLTHPLVDDISQHIIIDELGLTCKVLDVPGHTKGHIAYYLEEQEALFCGDTLFSAGCGRLFEGTAEQMQSSLEMIGALPDTTHIYCAHEYTLDNLGFALWVEPDNVDILAYQKKVQQLRVEDRASIPTQLKEEKLINPFLRTAQETVKQRAEKYAQGKLENNAAVFAILRSWKDKEYD